jgi:hypothetical protein
VLVLLVRVLLVLVPLVLVLLVLVPLVLVLQSLHYVLRPPPVALPPRLQPSPLPSQPSCHLCSHHVTCAPQNVQVSLISKIHHVPAHHSCHTHTRTKVEGVLKDVAYTRVDWHSCIGLLCLSPLNCPLAHCLSHVPSAIGHASQSCCGTLH